jgi:predicted dehydrogenase
MIANFHAKSISETENAVLAGVHNRSAAHPGAAAFGEKHGAPVFDTLDDMLSSPGIDVVCLCTPSGLHTPHALKAIAHGKHVVVEKPMSLTLAEADELIAAADKHKALVCVISQFRLAPAVAEVRRAMDAGAFGKVAMGELSMKYWRSAEYYASAGWRGTWALDGGGALMNQGIHGVDVFRHLMGPVKSISAYARTIAHSIEVEDSAAAAVEFESGALGVITGSTGSYPGCPRRIEICGDKGSVTLEEDSILKWDLPVECALPVGRAASNVASSNPGAISNEGHTRHFRNMADAVLNGAPLLNDARGGRLPLEIILGIYESSKTGKTVYLKSGQKGGTE